MARIAALLPDRVDRECLTAAAPPHDVVWVESWRELSRLVRRSPIAAAVADLHAESRKDGVLRVYRFRRRYPLTPLVVWGELDGRELFRLGKAGASDVIFSRDSSDRELVAEIVDGVLGRGLAPLLDERLQDRVEPEGREVLRLACRRIPEHVQVPDLASAFDMSVSTLERRCERWGLPTPGRLLLWLRVLYGMRWLLEPGRSVESVADQLGYSSGAAFRRAIKATLGSRPSPLRNAAGLDAAIEAFLAECSAPAGAVAVSEAG